MIFLKTGAETNGELLQIECFSPPTLEREPEHIHPFQENSFETISGSCIFRLNGAIEIEVHRFFHTNEGQEDRPSGTYKFIHI